MSNLIVIPPVMTAEEKFARLMQNPQIRERARRDPLFADRLMQSLRVPANRAQGPAIAPGARANFRQPAVGATLAAAPMSVSDAVRRQRDAFLVADQVQVTGDYDTEIRRKVGGVPAPKMPPVGFPAAQSYKYPSQKMIVGAALAGTTTTRGALPTSMFNPRAFIAARPDSQGNNLITNDPVGMPRRSLPRAERGGTPSLILATKSPSAARRRNISTLMGLGAGDKFFQKRHDPSQSAYQKTGDVWDILASAILYNESAMDDPEMQKFFAGMIDAIDRPQGSEFETYKRLKCDKIGRWEDVGYCSAENAKAIARLAVVGSILSDKIDLGAIPVGGGKNVNDWLNENLINLVPAEYKAIVQSMTGGGKIFPLDIRDLGLRRYLLEEIYAEVFPRAELKAAWYEALSNQLLNERSASMIRAAQILKSESEKYRPDAKTVPVTPLKAGVAPLSWDRPSMDTGKPAGGAIVTPPKAEGANTTILIAGGVAAAVLVGLGLWFKSRAKAGA